MPSLHVDGQRRTRPGQDQQESLSTGPRYKGRVRTGCLVCRSRKIKCDEQRPSCQKCTRGSRTCVYRIANRWGPLQIPAVSNQDVDVFQQQQEPARPDSISAGGTLLNGIENYPVLGQQFPPGNAIHSSPPCTLTVSNDVGPTYQATLPPINVQELSSGHKTGSLSHNFPSTGSSPSSLREASQLILLSTTIDWLAAFEVAIPSSFCYFIEQVDCPLLSPFDSLNWNRVKTHIARLGLQHIPVSKALLAIQAIYRAQVDRLSMVHARSEYQAAVDNFESIVSDQVIEFDVILVVAFLLCLCMTTLPNEENSLAVLDGTFIARLQAWLQGGQWEPVSLRICAWLQLLNTATKRSGSLCLLSEHISNLLYDHISDVPSLSLYYDNTPSEHSLFDAVSAPIFSFHLKVQRISNRVADITHYRRSRTTPEDQAQVTELVRVLKTDLAFLWENLPAPLRLPPDKLREHFSSQISDPLIALTGVCTAAFHTELVVIGRILGDQPFPCPETWPARERIRDIIDGKWNASLCGALNPGYIRPLFIYALESIQEPQTLWASNCLRRISTPISRSSFLASFIEEHGRAQRAQGRRVTMNF
ncbi:hypothetical protein FANTH_1021 [Fusarium anthophilum]|uniref:Zn(2)-C6 fungal-type domain-containing protein n=1 Tax=Fusarium anthophilum TaxID=48485 RepID=A0A8H4ZWW9_9HYPO|nr:hypothetical protein FANTH_1021 [Fusarium anthophilum]